jgi:hypothetical protein
MGLVRHRAMTRSRPEGDPWMVDMATKKKRRRANAPPAPDPDKSKSPMGLRFPASLARAIEPKTPMGLRFPASLARAIRVGAAKAGESKSEYVERLIRLGMRHAAND